MLKGINQWCLPDDTPLEKVFEISTAAGFDVVELNLYDSGGIGITVDSTAADIEGIGKLAEKYGLKLLSLSTGLLWRSPLSSADASVREQGRRVVEKQLETAKLLGIDTVLVVPGAVDAKTSYSDCYQRSQEELRKLVPLAEKMNISIGIENVWNKFLLSPLEMARYVDEFDSPQVGAYFDVGNVLQFGFPEHWIRDLGKRIRKVHVKDFNTAVGNINGFVPLLAGNVNWKEVAVALKEIGYDEVITAEIGAYAGAPYQSAFDISRHMDVIINGESQQH